MLKEVKNLGNKNKSLFYCRKNFHFFLHDNKLIVALENTKLEYQNIQNPFKNSQKYYKSLDSLASSITLIKNDITMPFDSLETISDNLISKVYDKKSKPYASIKKMVW